MSSSTKYCPASIDSDKILAFTKVTGLILSRVYREVHCFRKYCRSMRPMFFRRTFWCLQSSTTRMRNPLPKSSRLTFQLRKYCQVSWSFCLQKLRSLNRCIWKFLDIKNPPRQIKLRIIFPKSFGARFSRHFAREIAQRSHRRARHSIVMSRRDHSGVMSTLVIWTRWHRPAWSGFFVELRNPSRYLGARRIVRQHSFFQEVRWCENLYFEVPPGAPYPQ